MDLNLNFFNLLILVGAVNGLIITFLLLSLWNNAAARFLGLAILLFTLFTSWVVMIDTCLFCEVAWVPHFPLLFLTGLGPALYFYTSFTIDPSREWKNVELWHFTPLLLDLLINLTLRWFSQMESVPSFSTSISIWLSPFQTFLVAISIPIYLYLSFKKLKKAEAKGQIATGSWLRKIFAAYILFWLAWVPIEAIDLIVYDYQLGMEPYYHMFILQSALVYWMGLNGYWKARYHSFSTVVAGTAPNVLEVQNLKGLLVGRPMEYTSDEVREIVQALENERLFLDPRLTLDSLAGATGIPKRKLSYIINDHFERNFNELVNAYRVEEVKKKLLDPSFGNYSILGIALDCGFNSKSSFNRIFKKHCDQTPVEFLEVNKAYSV